MQSYAFSGASGMLAFSGGILLLASSHGADTGMEGFITLTFALLAAVWANTAAVREGEGS